MFDREHQPSLPQRMDHYGSAGTPLGLRGHEKQQHRPRHEDMDPL